MNDYSALTEGSVRCYAAPSAVEAYVHESIKFLSNYLRLCSSAGSPLRKDTC